MSNNELFKTIEQLKETLIGISSARQQVSETVAAYAQTQEKVHSYTENLIGIEHALSKLITLLQNNKVVIGQQSIAAISNLESSCDTLLDRTKAELSATSRKFAEHIAANLDVMANEAEKFGNTIKDACQFTSKVEVISDDVVKLISLITVLQQELSSSQAAQDKMIDNINNEILELKLVLNNSTDAIKQSLEYTQIDLKKAIVINRWTIIVGIVVLIILRLVF